ncbi:MAG: hypothetical protein U5L96_15040 [Owenweeksia sp.]|nr:hypothetical protein [Owenweeksia sp.]
MKNWKKIILLLLVLSPSFFFLSRAFAANEAVIKEQRLHIEGPGGVDVNLAAIKRVSWMTELPELQGTGGFSLGLIKKGNFIRASDKAEVRVIKNDEAGYIYLRTEIGDIYLSLSSEKKTRTLFNQLEDYKG